MLETILSTKLFIPPPQPRGLCVLGCLNAWTMDFTAN